MSVASVVYKEPETPAEKPAEVENKETAAAEVAAGSRPAWLPDNFKTVEDFVKSATDSRAELTRVQQELAKLKGGEEKKTEGEQAPEEKKTEGEKPAGEKSETEKAAEEAMAKAGIDVDPFQKEFNETGDVSEENRGKIAESLKAQFGDNAKAYVDAFIEGQKSRRANFSAEVYGAVGGEEAYGQMITWAATGMTDAQKTTFNEGVLSGDLNKAKMAVASLQSLYTKANGKAPSLLGGDPPATQVGFASSFEMQKAIADPRYAADPVYRKSVEERIKKSNF